MKPSDPLLLADVSLHCGMYPAGKVDISQHLAILKFLQSDHTVIKPNGDAGLLASNRPLLFSFGTFDSFLAGHPKIECMVHDALTKMSKNQFKPVQQIRQQALDHTVLSYLLLG